MAVELRYDVTQLFEHINTDKEQAFDKQFYGIAAQAVGRSPVDHARTHKRLKRGVKREWSMTKAWRHAELRENTPRADRPHGC
jgi:hypothetical protein